MSTKGSLESISFSFSDKCYIVVHFVQVVKELFYFKVNMSDLYLYQVLGGMSVGDGFS